MTKPHKIKYLVIASIYGQIYGAFYPDDSENADDYLSKLKKAEPSIKMQIFAVSNLNKFLAKLKYDKRNQRKINRRDGYVQCKR